MPTALLSADGSASLLLTVAGIMAGGLLCQALARRFRLPAIVPLLVVGIVVGRDSLGWLDPGVLGDGLGVLVGLAVAIILFEGGLTLRPDAFRVAGRPIRISGTYDLIAHDISIVEFGGSSIGRMRPPIR